MADLDVTDLTFYSAADHLNKQKSRRQAAFEARKEAEVVALDSESGVPVQSTRNGTGGLKLMSRSGRRVASKSQPQVRSSLQASSMPGGDAARVTALQQLVRERAVLMAATNNHGRK